MDAENENNQNRGRMRRSSSSDSSSRRRSVSSDSIHHRTAKSQTGEHVIDIMTKIIESNQQLLVGREKADHLSSKLCKIGKLLERHKTHVASLELDKRASDATCRNLSSEIKTLRATIEKMSAAAEALSAENKDLRATVEEVSTEAASNNSDDDAASAREKAPSPAAAVSAAAAATEDQDDETLQAQLGEIEQVIKSTNRNLDALRAVVDDALAKIEQANKEKGRLQEKAESLRSQLGKLCSPSNDDMASARAKEPSPAAAVSAAAAAHGDISDEVDSSRVVGSQQKSNNQDALEAAQQHAAGLKEIDVYLALLLGKILFTDIISAATFFEDILVYGPVISFSILLHHAWNDTVDGKKGASFTSMTVAAFFGRFHNFGGKISSEFDKAALKKEYSEHKLSNKKEEMARKVAWREKAEEVAKALEKKFEEFDEADVLTLEKVEHIISNIFSQHDGFKRIDKSSIDLFAKRLFAIHLAGKGDGEGAEALSAQLDAGAMN